MKGAGPQDLAEALRQAKTAVEQTAECDFSALDTLAFAHQRNGEKDAALAAMRKALKLKPDHPDLRRRLEAIEAGR
jgi:Flp pilus assembly protein TadD